MKVAVSIHAKDNFNPNLIKGLKGLDYIHIDVMDGIFVSTKNLNLEAFRSIKENYKIPIIAHLMVNNPLSYIPKIIEFCYAFLFHFEIQEDINAIIEKVKANGKKVGLVINPETNISEIIEYLPLLDIVLVLGVKPGRSGQLFLPNTIKKINKLAEFKKKYNFEIDVDGGVNLQNAKKLFRADILTSASTILNAKNPNKVIQELNKIS